MPTITKKQSDLIKFARAGGNDSVLFLLDRIGELEDLIGELNKKIEGLSSNDMDVVNKVAKNVLQTIKTYKGDKGDKGDRGDDGYSPKKGRDYFTDQELNSISNFIINESAAKIHALIRVPKDGAIGPVGPVGPQGLRGPQGKDGKDGVVDPRLVNDALRLELGKLGKYIRDALEGLNGNERLSVDAISGLKEELAKFKKGGKVVYVGGGAGATAGRIVKSYDIYSQLNGVLKTFTLPSFYRVISVHSSSFPYAFRETVDYTTDATAMTITFTSEITASATLAAGQTITIVYSEA